MSSDLDARSKAIAASCRVQAVLESVRRVCLVLGLFLVAFFATWSDFRPYYRVSPLSKWDKIELEAKLTKARSNEGAGKQSRKQNSLLMEDREPTSTGDENTPVIDVDPTTWNAWFADARQTFENANPPDHWLFRLSKDQLKEVKRHRDGRSILQPDIRSLFFAQNEEPIASLFNGGQPGQTVLVSMISNSKRNNVKIYYSEAPKLTGLGSSLFGIPEAFSYPLRKFWYWPLLIMMAVYCTIPRAKLTSNACSYKTWQIILGDFAACLLFGMFMMMPFFIVGTAQGVLNDYLLFSSFFWLLAAVGLSLLWFNNIHACFRIVLLPEALIWVTPAKVLAVAYTDISSVQPVSAVPPKWLIILSLIAALFTRGTARFGAAGRASLLAGSSSEGLCLSTKKGVSLYVWLTNPVGQVSLSNVRLLLQKLDETTADKPQDMRQIEVVYPPLVEESGKRNTGKLLKAEPGTEPFLKRLLSEFA